MIDRYVSYIGMIQIVLVF